MESWWILESLCSYELGRFIADWFQSFLFLYTLAHAKSLFWVFKITKSSYTLSAYSVLKPLGSFYNPVVQFHLQPLFVLLAIDKGQEKLQDCFNFYFDTQRCGKYNYGHQMHLQVWRNQLYNYPPCFCCIAKQDCIGIYWEHLLWWKTLL